VSSLAGRLHRHHRCGLARTPNPRVHNCTRSISMKSEIGKFSGRAVPPRTRRSQAPKIDNSHLVVLQRRADAIDPVVLVDLFYGYFWWFDEELLERVSVFL
jgi:hypothetical protein